MPFLQTKLQAQASIKRLNTALVNLTPTSLITLFEIDISQLVLDQGVSLGQLPSSWGDGIFRFHNNLKIFNSVIYWQGNQFIAAPIKADGFEFTARGTLPTPKLGISVSPEGILALGVLKQQISRFDDLIGAKVTRIRTYAECLDAENFFGTDVTYNVPDPNAELPRDIYYIDRKSAENKSIIEFELASILDTEGVKLPNRLVLANRCTATYRCEGCLYEYRDRFSERADSAHAYNGTNYGPNNVLGDATSANLPKEAPAIANDKDELIRTIINSSVSPPVVFDAADLNKYGLGQTVWITKNNVPYYFVAKTASPASGPPNSTYWEADQCSKTIKGCKIRWKDSATLPNFSAGTLPIVAFPSCNKIR